MCLYGTASERLMALMKLFSYIFIVGCCSGCSALAQQADFEARLDQQRSEAIAYSHKGQHELAVSAIREAIALSHFLPVTSWRSIESYDDAGLYYYSSQRYKESTYHQVIAVLLACGEPARASMYPIYVKRLSWAFARYRPDQRFQPIADNPLRLLNDTRLNLKQNRHIRRKYYRARYSSGKARYRWLGLNQRPAKDVIRKCRDQVGQQRGKHRTGME